jgi:hypothetical protein
MQAHLPSPLPSQLSVQEQLHLQDRPSKILNILCFLCPPLGLIVYLALVGKLPRQALSASLSAAKGIATLLGLLFLIALGGLAFWFMDDVLHLFGQPVQAPDTVTLAPSPFVAPR